MQDDETFVWLWKCTKFHHETNLWGSMGLPQIQQPQNDSLECNRIIFEILKRKVATSSFRQRSVWLETQSVKSTLYPDVLKIKTIIVVTQNL